MPMKVVKCTECAISIAWVMATESIPHLRTVSMMTAVLADEASVFATNLSFRVSQMLPKGSAELLLLDW